MEEIKTLSFLFTLNHFACKYVILFAENRYIFGSYRIIFLRRRDDRLHRDLVKTKVSQMKNIRSEVKAARLINGTGLKVTKGGEE